MWNFQNQDKGFPVNVTFMLPQIIYSALMLRDENDFELKFCKKSQAKQNKIWLNFVPVWLWVLKAT